MLSLLKLFGLPVLHTLPPTATLELSPVGSGNESTVDTATVEGLNCYS